MRKTRYSIIVLIILLIQCNGPDTGTKGSWKNPAFDYVAEARGVWGGNGNREGEIDTMMMKLADAGINMIFPNISTAGQAGYPSNVLPMKGDVDKLAILVKSAHKYGIEIHAWRINWFMGWGPESFAEEMKKQNRIQYSWDGRRNGLVMKEMGYNQPEDWLCPSHPANRELEKEAMLELVRNYDVDGVHFDYMRFSNDHFCYCDGCKERFSGSFGLTIKNWPDPVWKGGELREVYLEWRRQLIHTSARDIARAVHTLDPYVSVTLAARSGIDWCTYSDGQEWWKWCDEGILDILCAMNYSNDSTKFIKAIDAHLPLMKGSAPYYSGLGMYQMDSYDQLAANANAGRIRGHDGWIAFNQKSIMPYLGDVKEGISNKPALLPHRAPEVSWRFDDNVEETPQGYPRFEAKETISVDISVMFKAMIHEGISHIKGDFCLVDMDGNILEELKYIDLDEAKRLKLELKYNQPGRYRLGLYGEMDLSNGDSTPFITKSFPFEIINI